MFVESDITQRLSVLHCKPKIKSSSLTIVYGPPPLFFHAGVTGCREIMYLDHQYGNILKLLQNFNKLTGFKFSKQGNWSMDNLPQVSERCNFLP